MKTLSSWFGTSRALGSAILSIVLLSTFLALATSANHTLSKLNSNATPLVSVGPACPASAVFSASFTGGQNPSPEAAQQWKDFIQSLTSTGYDTVTISGTFDSVGRTLTDATVVPQIAAAMQNGSTGSWTVGTVTWNVGGCDGVELNANDAGPSGTDVCNCPSPGYVVRPEIKNSNWGGINTAACGGPSQTITVTFSGPGLAAPPCATPPSGMISWWPAEGDANDIQGSNDGTPVGTVTFAPGEVGQAFNFDGVSGFENMGTPASLDLTNTLTLDAWINPNDSTKQGVYFGKANSGQNDYALFLLGDLTGCIKTADGIEHFLHTGFVPPAGVWTHIALTYDGSNEIVYANGIEIGRVAVSGSIRSEGIPFFIGGRNGDAPANSLYINAKIDEVEVFNRALSKAEILSIHDAGCAGKCRSCVSAPGGMISWWPGNGNGNDVEDGNPVSAGNGNGIGFGAGEVGQAFNFNGTQFASAGNPANLNIAGNQVTIDAWVNPSADMTNEVVFFGKWGDGAIQYILGWENGTLAGRVNNGNVGATFTPPTGVWTHLALVYNGSANPSVVIYVNGVVLTSSGAQSGNITSTTSSFLIGGTDDGRDFKGGIDEVEVFNRALTLREVQRIYDAGSAGKCPCLAPPPNMTGWWPGDGNLFDIQGGHNGTDAGGGPGFAAGKVDQAFAFDGIDDFVSAGNPNAFQFGTTNPFSVDAWVYYDSLGDPSNPHSYCGGGLGCDMEIVRKGPDNSDGWMLLKQADNRFWVCLGGNCSPGSEDTIVSTTVAVTGTWYHVALSRSATEFALYVNGVKEATKPIPAFTNSDSADLTIGRATAGRIDEVEVFSRALTADEVKAVYDAGIAGKCKPVISGLWYNGDFDNEGGLRNENSASAMSSIYDNFIVPAGQQWTVTSILSNDLTSATITGADWSIRSSVSAGNGGTIVASGTNSPVILSQTGRTGFGFDESTVRVSGLHVTLPAGTYWLNVTPVSPSAVSYNSTTLGANAVGQPPGNDHNSFFDSSSYGQNFSPQALDFSMGVDGSVCQTSTFYLDADGDGYGDAANTVDACTAPTGYVSDSTDCDDANPDIHPGATEVCDGVDNNCDGQIDEGVTTTFYRDADGDGYGDATVSSVSCSAPSGYVGDNTDCDDSDAAIHPGATELCDGKDNNCDGQIDEGVTTTFYRDADGDGYGNPNTTIQACAAPSGYVATGMDCDDTDAAVHPGATEICDGKDNNCNGQIDEGVKTTFYRDADGDGYGDPNTTIQACSAPSGYVATGTDCDDTDAAVHPGATEICDGKDNNCNGQIDEGVKTTFYRDADGDGYGNPNTTTQACSAPSGYVSNNTDCNDSNAAVHPGATELCDGVDNNCNGQVDEGCDTTPPVITVPANIVVKANAKRSRQRGSYVSFTVSATDNIDGTVPANANPPSGSFFPIGITTVVVTAEDSHHNMSQKSFTVTVKKKL